MIDTKTGKKISKLEERVENCTTSSKELLRQVEKLQKRIEKLEKLEKHEIEVGTSKVTEEEVEKAIVAYDKYVNLKQEFEE